MKLFIICDNLAKQAEQKSFGDYYSSINPDYVCYAPSHAHSGAKFNGLKTWGEVIGSGEEFSEIYFLGHGDINSIGGLNFSSIAALVNVVKPEASGCTVTLLACGTADQKQQVLHSGGAYGFQAKNLVENVATLLSSNDKVVGLSVPLPFNSSSSLAFNPAQGEVVTKSGGSE